MAAIPTQSFLTIVKTIASGVQGRATQILDFSVGSVLRAIADGFSSVCLWLQSIALQIANQTRLSTSSGSDVDTWINDWDLERLGGTFASGSVTFSRNTAGSSAPFIPIDATVASSDGSQSFTVTVDEGNPYYQASPAGYVMPANIASITVPVQCVSPGNAGNVQAGAVSVITSSLTGIDTVVNTAALVNGQDIETDDGVKTRFIAFIASLSKATVAALKYSVTSLAPNVQATVIENLNADLTPNAGFVTVTVDAGSGIPTQALIDASGLAVNLTRAAGVDAGVFSPVVITADINVVIATVTGYEHQTVVATVGTAVQNFVNTLPLGAPLYFNKLSQVIFESSPGVANITLLNVNGFTEDIPVTNRNVIKIGQLAVS